MKVYRQNAYDAATYRAHYEAWYGGLSVPQQAAIYDYTGSGYRSLNHCLRYGKTLDPKNVNLLTHLDAALATHPPKPTRRRLMRAVKQLTHVYEPGGHLSIAHYVSTTSDPHQLFKFADPAAPVIFEIDAAVGTPVSDIHDEYEFLMPRNTTFRVEAVQHGIDWHAEYAGTDYSRALHNATVITLTQDDHDPRNEIPAPHA